MPNLQEIIKLIESKKKRSFPWERQKPAYQEYYSYSANSRTWLPQSPPAGSSQSLATTATRTTTTTATATATTGGRKTTATTRTTTATTTTTTSSTSSSSPPLKRFRVLAWNIDFMLPYPNERMQAALDHVHSLVTAARNNPASDDEEEDEDDEDDEDEGSEDDDNDSQNNNRAPTEDDEPSIIFFNEMVVSDLQLIQAQPWIQQGYNITDIDSRFWESGHYGTCTLVPKSLPIAAVFRVHYAATNMERDALFVDLDVGSGSGSGSRRLITLCNSHLESLVAQPPLRPEQVRTAAKYLHRRGSGSGGGGGGGGGGGEAVVVGGVMGGDFNAIQPFDRSLHVENGLKDAFLELGGREDTDEGYTWGQMAPIKQREMFGCSRMDKFFFCGDLDVIDFQRFGKGVEVKHAGIRRALVEDEGMDGGWVTDHLGIMATFKLPSIATTRL